MNRVLFDIIRRLVKKVPRGKSFIINTSLRVLGTYYGGVITVQGFKFWIERINALNRSLFFLGIYEPGVTATVREFVKPGMQVFDVGANFGWYTILMANLVGPHGRVYSFDMAPTLISVLRKNVALNNLSNVVVTHAALGNQNAEVSFYDDQLSGTANLSDQLVQNNERGSVAMITFDDFIKNNGTTKIDFIKCDIDGAENLFIEGARHSLMKVPRMIIEIFDQAQRVFHSSGIELTEKLKSLGYRLWNIELQSELKESDIDDCSSVNVICTRS